jgi:vancomycin resistance protein VanJ
MHSLFRWLTAFYLITLILYLILRFAFGDQFWWLAFLNNFAPYYFLPTFILLPLALLLRDKMTTLRLLPVVVIALIWFGAYFVPKATAQSTGTPLKVLTFNLWGGNTELANIALWIREVNPDVVLFQEAHRPYDVESGMLGLRDLYPYQAIESPSPDLWGRTIISQHPILSEEYFNSLGIQRLTLDINGETIAVYNVHFHVPMQDGRHINLPLSQPYLNMLLSYNDENRNQQIDAFLAHIETETLPYIVAGDFNMSDNAAPYPRLAAVMNDAFREVGTGFGASWPALFSYIPPLVRIDYIWHSDHFRTISVTQGPDIGSDHLPLYAMLDLKP